MALRNVALVSRLLLLSLSGFHLFGVSLAAGWHYGNGENGPDDWPGLCQAGTRQSPIDLDPDTSVAGYFEPLVLINYDRRVTANITNNGHTVMFMAEQPCELMMAAGGLPEVYKMAQIHFHWKAEHTFRGKRLPLEMHIVHYNRKYSSVGEAAKHHQGIAVLGVLFYKSEQPNSAYTPIIDAVARVINQDAVYNLPQQIRVNDLVPHEIKSFYRYQGSLTTPNCDESVVWTVVTHLVPIGSAQVEQFHKIKSVHGELKANYRPIQKLHNRRIFLQHPRDLGYETTSVSSKMTLSWILISVCGLIPLFS